MAKDAIAIIRALGYDKVDLLGFSLGGFVAQSVAQTQPDLVRKLILAGTGPAGVAPPASDSNAGSGVGTWRENDHVTLMVIF